MYIELRAVVFLSLLSLILGGVRFGPVNILRCAGRSGSLSCHASSLAVPGIQGPGIHYLAHLGIS
jgi:hypothetical protein